MNESINVLFEVEIDNYNGPLDVLLELAKALHFPLSRLNFELFELWWVQLVEAHPLNIINNIINKMFFIFWNINSFIKNSCPRSN